MLKECSVVFCRLWFYGINLGNKEHSFACIRVGSGAQPSPSMPVGSQWSRKFRVTSPTSRYTLPAHSNLGFYSRILIALSLTCTYTVYDSSPACPDNTSQAMEKMRLPFRCTSRPSPLSPHLMTFSSLQHSLWSYPSDLRWQMQESARCSAGTSM